MPNGKQGNTGSIKNAQERNLSTKKKKKKESRNNRTGNEQGRQQREVEYFWLLWFCLSSDSVSHLLSCTNECRGSYNADPAIGR